MTGNNNINQYVDKKPFELVQELKNETLSFKEFMKTYESDANLNYDDLNGGGIGEAKEYGPCSSCNGNNRSLKFELKITLENCMSSWRRMTVYNTNSAREQARKIKAETDYWEDRFLDYFSQEDRRKLANRINEKIDYHKRGNKVETSVCNKDSDGYNALEDENYADFLSGCIDPYNGP